jgi:hypothetical protein
LNPLASFLQALSPSAAPQNLGKASGSPDAGFENTTSFSDVLSEEVSHFPIEEQGPPSSVEQKLLIAEEANKLESSDLAEALVGLEEELESLGEEGVLLLLNFFHELESTGPIGIRVQGHEGTGAALPVEAEQAWTQLALALQGMVKLEGAQVENPELQDVTKLSQLLSRLIDGLKKSRSGDGSDLQTQKVTQKQTVIDPQKQVQESSIQDAVSSDQTLKTAVTQSQPEFTDEKSTLESEKNKVSSTVEFTKKENAEHVDSKESKVQESVKKASSAVVVLNSVVDGLRSRVLKALDASIKSSASVEPLSQKMFDAGDWDQLKGWLEKAVATAGESLSKATVKLSAKDALGFLNFMAQKRQSGWGSSVALQTSEESVEANVASEKSSKEVKSEALSGVSLKALSTNKAELSYGAAAARRAMTPLPLPEQAEGLLNPVKVDELSRSEDVAEVKVDVAKGVQEKDPSLDQASLKAVSETDRSAKEAKSLSGSTGPRFDQELVERVLTQTKQNLRVWMDRKLVAMEIQMEPVELGKMQMRTVLEQGRIGVLLQVENAAVKELIQQQLQDMRAVLEAQGLEVAGFYVEVWQREQGGAHGEGEKTSGPKFDLDRLLADDGSDDDPKPPQKKSLIDQVA